MQCAKAQKSVSFSLGGELYLVFGLGWIRRRTILILIKIVYSRKDEKPQGFCFLFRCCASSLLPRTCFGQSVGFCSFSFYLGFEKSFLSIEILLCENLPTGCCCFIFKIEADFQKLSQKTCGLIFDGRLLFQLLDSIAVSLFVGIGWVGITH